ncbi:MAG: beta-galactosidase [Oligosphaeraceae bacterium]
MSWQNRCYARLLVDNHITDQRPEYMRDFSPEEYVRLVKRSGSESSMVYACDHNGNCYYPTKAGHPHGNLAGRDLFGEVVSLLRKEGIAPIAYYTATYHNDCARRFPQAEIVNSLGQRGEGRYHFTCPNHPEALEFYQRQIAEILSYEVDGLFIDMSFWPAVCRCPACRKKFGRPLPERIHWSDPQWLAFQRFREQSMAEFARKLTDFAKKCRPEVTVAHQFSPVLHGWYLGQSLGIARASDYASGDFYGEKLQQRFAVKTFDAFTQTPPFEFMTSRCIHLRDHTTSKSPAELELSALTTLANGGAYFFIDAISPNGTLFPRFYQQLGEINRRLAPFRTLLRQTGARLEASVGLFFSIECCVDRSLDGMPLQEFDGGRSDNMAVRENAVLNEVLGTAEVLIQSHVPFRVVTEGDEDFSFCQVLFLNRTTYLSRKTRERLKNFVADGGTLVATGDASLFTPEGEGGDNFALAEVFGVDFTGSVSDRVTYTGEELLSATGRVPLVTPRPGCQVLSRLTFPDFPVDDPAHYASIHSNPPGATPSPYPAICLNEYGKGRCLWIAAPILAQRHYTQQTFAKEFLKPYLPEFLVSSQNLPDSAEVTLLKEKAGNRRILCVVNQQEECPPVPLGNVQLEVKLPFPVRRLTRVADGVELPVLPGKVPGTLLLQLPRVEMAEFLLLE